MTNDLADKEQFGIAEKDDLDSEIKETRTVRNDSEQPPVNQNIDEILKMAMNENLPESIVLDLKRWFQRTEIVLLSTCVRLVKQIRLKWK